MNNDGFTLVWGDRTGVKERGVERTSMISGAQKSVLKKHCDKDSEFSKNSCDTFHFPREFGKRIMFVVYIATDAEEKIAAQTLQTV